MKLQAVGIGKRFGQKRVLERVDMEIDSGEIVAVFGPNGSGKTTLLKLLATLLTPDNGSILLDRRPVLDSIRRYRRDLGVLLHNRMIYENLTVRENLLYACRIYGIPDPCGISEKLIFQVGLGGSIDERVSRLSEGMKQRLAIARVFVNSPKIVLLDEPFSSLDEIGIETLIEMIQTHASAGGMSVIASHRRDLATRISTQTMEIVRGSLCTCGQ